MHFLREYPNCFFFVSLNWIEVGCLLFYLFIFIFHHTYIHIDFYTRLKSISLCVPFYLMAVKRDGLGKMSLCTDSCIFFFSCIYAFFRWIYIYIYLVNDQNIFWIIIFPNRCIHSKLGLNDWTIGVKQVSLTFQNLMYFSKLDVMMKINMKVGINAWE